MPIRRFLPVVSCCFLHHRQPSSDLNAHHDPRKVVNKLLKCFQIVTFHTGLYRRALAVSCIANSNWGLPRRLKALQLETFKPLKTLKRVCCRRSAFSRTRIKFASSKLHVLSIDCMSRRVVNLSDLGMNYSLIMAHRGTLKKNVNQAAFETTFFSIIEPTDGRKCSLYRIHLNICSMQAPSLSLPLSG